VLSSDELFQLQKHNLIVSFISEIRQQKPSGFNTYITEYKVCHRFTYLTNRGDFYTLVGVDSKQLTCLNRGSPALLTIWKLTIKPVLIFVPVRIPSFKLILRATTSDYVERLKP